jgi:hypothetical protein
MRRAGCPRDKSRGTDGDVSPRERAPLRSSTGIQTARAIGRPEASLVGMQRAHHHAVAHILVRGIAKVTCVALLAALAANLLQHAAGRLA